MDAASFDATHQYVHRLLELLLSVQQAPAAERAATFRRARRLLHESVQTMPPLQDDRPALRATYRRCLRRLAHEVGGVAARAWALAYCRPLLPPAQASGGC